MARYVTTIQSSLSPDEAFAYMADFANARFWDPSVTAAQRSDDGQFGAGSSFHLVARFGGRNVELDYVIDAYEPPRRVVLEARRPSFVSRDTITVEPAEGGSAVHYDARLDLQGPGRFLDFVFQRLFDRTGDKAAAGMRTALNP
jgi:Polyketide cyclase / dehydrase and lipid transport